LIVASRNVAIDDVEPVDAKVEGEGGERDRITLWVIRITDRLVAVERVAVERPPQVDWGGKPRGAPRNPPPEASELGSTPLPG
jgi:hypothetical protein